MLGTRINTPSQSRVSRHGMTQKNCIDAVFESMMNVSDVLPLLTHMPVVHRGMVFGEVISSIVGTFVPKHVEEFFVLLVAQPVQLHVPSFGLSHLHVSVDKPCGGAVVCSDWRGLQLGMSHLF